LGARIFSKSFGGKIEHGQTNVNKETTFTKKLTQHPGLKNLFFTLRINFRQFIFLALAISKRNISKTIEFPDDLQKSKKQEIKIL